MSRLSWAAVLYHSVRVGGPDARSAGSLFFPALDVSRDAGSARTRGWELRGGEGCNFTRDEPGHMIRLRPPLPFLPEAKTSLIAAD
jgi:hypothetical protein